MDYTNDFRPENGAKTTSHQRNLQILPYPWHRFFARMTDRTIFSLVTILIYMVFIKRAPILATGNSERIYLAVAAVVTIICESFMLSLVGTTPGKWLFGIHLSTGYGENLSFADALKRNFKRFIFAEGAFIPILSQIAMLKAYKSCKAGSPMDYDDYTLYEFRKRPLALGIFGMVINEAAVFILAIVLTICFMTVPNKGDITTAQFIENYNHLIDYTYTEDTTRRLDEILRFDTRELNEIRYEKASVVFGREGTGDTLDGLSVRVSAYADGLYEYRHEFLFMAMSLGDGGIKDRFDILFNKVYGMGLDKDVSFTYGNIKADYNIEIDNFKLNYNKNIYSKNRGYSTLTYGKNPDGTINYNETVFTERGRGRHSFERKGDDGTLVINYNLSKK